MIKIHVINFSALYIIFKLNYLSFSFKLKNEICDQSDTFFPPFFF